MFRSASRAGSSMSMSAHVASSGPRRVGSHGRPTSATAAAATDGQAAWPTASLSASSALCACMHGCIRACTNAHSRARVHTQVGGAPQVAKADHERAFTITTEQTQLVLIAGALESHTSMQRMHARTHATPRHAMQRAPRRRRRGWPGSTR